MSTIQAVQVEGGSVEVMNHFTYLGSNTTTDGEVTVKYIS